jgi:hypothetical protein
VPPTATGLPRSAGLSRCSTEAKKASMSMWMIFRMVQWNVQITDFRVGIPRNARQGDDLDFRRLSIY